MARKTAKVEETLEDSSFRWRITSFSDGPFFERHRVAVATTEGLELQLLFTHGGKQWFAIDTLRREKKEKSQHPFGPRSCFEFGFLKAEDPRSLIVDFLTHFNHRTLFEATLDAENLMASLEEIYPFFEAHFSAVHDSLYRRYKIVRQLNEACTRMSTLTFAEEVRHAVLHGVTVDPSGQKLG